MKLSSTIGECYEYSMFGIVTEKLIEGLGCLSEDVRSLMDRAENMLTRTIRSLQFISSRPVRMQPTVAELDVDCENTSRSRIISGDRGHA